MAWGVAPEAQRPVLGAGASTSGDPGLPPEEAAVRLLRDLLAAFFQAYLEDASEVRKPQMSLLLAQAHQHGLVGARVLPALAALHDALRPELDAGPEKFAAFYHFVFFVARERGDRNLRAEAATHAWAFALANGRFTLLERFCAFVKGRRLPRGVSEDTWCQVLDFANAARAFASAEDVVAAYDPRGAWPVLVDEFVDHLRGGVSVPNESQSTSTSLSQSSPQEDERWRVTGWARRDRDSGFSPPDAWDSAMDASARVDAAVYTGGARAGRGRASGGTTARGRGGGGLTGVGAAANPEWGGGRRRAERRGRRGGAPAPPPGAGCGRGVQAPPERGAGDGWARHAAGEAGARGVSRVRRPGRRRARSVDVDVPGYPAARLRRAEPGHGVADAKVRARRLGAPRDVDDAKQATRA